LLSVLPGSGEVKFSLLRRQLATGKEEFL